MRLFDKIKSCQILKKGSNAENEILELKEILDTCPESEKNNIKQSIRNLEYGIKGENNILFELKNSRIPMLVLQDLYLEYDWISAQLEYEKISAQIDFLILTRNKHYIIESKNMYGDVIITDNGEFYRKRKGKSHKIYSPITQCERHVDLVRKIRYDARGNIITKALFEKFGAKNYYPLVVMANPTGKINTKYAPEDIKNKIISVDQLVRHLVKNHTSKAEITEKDMIELGEFFLKLHKENPQNYMEKYRKLKDFPIEEIVEVNEEVQPINTIVAPATVDDINEIITCSRCGNKMILRVAKKGHKIGDEFYGCSSFPKCRNTLKTNELK